MSESRTESQPEPVLTVSLPVSAWVVIGNHLRRGAYEDVATVIAEIYRQTVGKVLPHDDLRTATDAATAAVRRHREEFDAAQAAEAQREEAASIPLNSTPRVVN